MTEPRDLAEALRRHLREARAGTTVPATGPKCHLDIEGIDCPRPAVWRWFLYGHPGESVYICDEHAADKDLSDLRDLTGLD